MLDDKGEALQLINHGMNVKKEGKVTNAFEFIGGSSELKQIKLVPVQRLEDGLCSIPQLIDIKHLPKTVPVGKEGKIIIHSVEIQDDFIKVQYEKQGILLDRGPLFTFYDSTIEDKAQEINVIDPATNPGGQMIMSVDRTSGIYTRILERDTEREKKEDLKRIESMLIWAADEIELLEEQAIVIELSEK